MGIGKKYMDWRDRRMNGPRREAEAEARTAGKSDSEVADAGKAAERRRRLRSSLGAFLGGG